MFKGTTTKEKVTEVFTLISDTVHNLSFRWDEEKEYEDIEDYRKVLQSKLDGFCEVKSMTKRPFGFKTKINELDVAFYIKKSGDTQELCAKVVKKGE